MNEKAHCKVLIVNRQLNAGLLMDIKVNWHGAKMKLG